MYKSQIQRQQLQPPTLELTINQKQLDILEVFKDHAEDIQNIILLSNDGCSLHEMKSILYSVENKRQEVQNQCSHKQEDLSSQVNVTSPLVKQPEPYRFIHQLLVNNSYYTHFFASSFQQQFRRLQKTYDVQFVVSFGECSVKSCKKLSPFFKKQFAELQMQFRCFISKSTEILKKLKYSNLLEEKLREMKIFFSIIIHNCKESIVFYNKCKIDELAMANIIEEICQGHMAVVSFEDSHDEGHSHWNPLNLIPAVLKREIEIIETVYRASIEFNSKTEVFLIHSQHQCFSRQTGILFRDALNSLLIFTIEGIDNSKASVLAHERQNVNLNWLKMMVKDSNLCIAINTVGVDSEKISKVKCILEGIMNSKSKVNCLRAHYSKTKLKNQFKNQLVSLANKYKLYIKQKILLKNKDNNCSNLSICSNSEAKSQALRLIIQALMTYIQQYHTSKALSLLYPEDTLTNTNKLYEQDKKHEVRLEISLL